MRAAYPAAPPSAVRARLETLKAAAPDDVYGCSVFEREPADAPLRLRLRLGNRGYPHMKLVIERSPDGRGFLLRADTHDQHVRPPPGSRDAMEFQKLMELNQQIAAEIDAAWESANLPTFKKYLRDDLARRQGT